ncbi:MAG: phosphoribosyl-AMP cyclohydrolase [Pseudomonadota bacterium]
MSDAFPPPLSGHDQDETVELRPKFDANGLIAAVAQDSASGEVLMLAWMNAEALQATLDTRKATFWSRSRGKLWMKGETSGNELLVDEVRIDCDQDAVVMMVTPKGGACHTGRRSCFYRVADSTGGELSMIEAPPSSEA